MRHFFLLFALGSLAVLGVACSTNTKEKEPEPNARVEALSEAELVKANNQFALDLYGQFRTERGNLFVSPYSISTALGMTYAGARGATADQMAKALHFPSDERRLHPAFVALHKRIHNPDANGYQIQSANALWLQDGFVLLPEFVETSQKYYDGSVREIDFKNAAAPASINDWVAKQTKDRIKNLLQPSDLPRLTRMVLTNAIYFKGDWAARFPKAGTQDRYFYRKNGDSVTVPLMAQCAEYPFWEDDNLQVAEIPYVGKQLSMVVILPRSAEGLPAVEKTLSSENIAGWVSRLKEAKINVYLPRFKAALRLDLKQQLSNLGMPLAFDRDQADFTGMTGADPEKQLHISKVIHEAFVEINEEGTEAAGATAVIELAKSAVGEPSVRVPPTFRADRPFVFVIRDNPSGSILFIGRLSDPAK